MIVEGMLFCLGPQQDRIRLERYGLLSHTWGGTPACTGGYLPVHVACGDGPSTVGRNLGTHQEQGDMMPHSLA